MNLLSKIANLFKKNDTPPEENGVEYDYLIWGVTEGPISREDVPEEFVSDVDEDLNFFLVVKASDKGQMVVDNIWFATLKEALDVKYYFDTNIEPLVYKD